jgi:hypothetical protein
MKNTIVKLWHGFLYGIGAAIAWWLVFGLLGYTLIDQLPYFKDHSPTETRQEATDDNSRRKELNTKELRGMEIPDANLPKIE